MPAFLIAFLNTLVSKAIITVVILLASLVLVETVLPIIIQIVDADRWMQNIQVALGANMTEMFSYLYGVFKIGFGLNVVIATIFTRFIIRRTPFIG